MAIAVVIDRILVTRVGKIELRVPQDRGGKFSTEVFERYQRSEKALVSALVEMYVQGVSTRKVAKITEQLCGHQFSASSISAMVVRLDEQLKEFSERELEEKIPCLMRNGYVDDTFRRHDTGVAAIGFVSCPFDGPGFLSRGLLLVSQQSRVGLRQPGMRQVRRT